MTVRGKSLIAPIEYLSAQWRDGKQISRIRPPNPSHRVTVGVCALDLIAICQQQTQILQQAHLVQLQLFPDPARLKRGNFKSAFAQGVFPKRNPPPAKSAGIIVKNPAGRLSFELIHVVNFTP